jgi:hypothetical protein
MAKLIDLNFKRNVNVFTQGNPERAWPHVLQTVGFSKSPILDFKYANIPQIDSRISWARNITATVMAYAANAVAGDSPVLTTIAANLPRFTNARYVGAGVWSNALSDGTPIVLPITLLAEEARTNLCLNSTAINSTNYTSNPILTIGQLAPDGSLNATLVTGSGTNVGQRFFKSITLAANTVFTCSVFVKAGSSRYFALHGVGSGGANAFYVIVDTTNWTFVNTTNTLSSGVFISRGLSSTPTPNNFYRISVTGSVPDVAAIIRVSLTNDINNPIPSYSTVETAIVWQLQCEPGYTASSPIYTAGAEATRLADVPSFTGANLSWYNSQQGTFVIKASGQGFRTPSPFGAFNLTLATSGTYVLVYNNTVKDGSTYLYTLAGGSTPVEYTGISIPTTISLLQSGLVNISSFSYYSSALPVDRILSLLS